MIENLIFDLDGTLWDSTGACVRGWNVALTELGISRKVTDKDLHSIMGMPHEAIYQKLFPEMTESQREEVARRTYAEELLTIQSDGGGRLFPGVSEGIEKLSGRYRLFVVSNCLQDYMDTFFDSSGLKSYFSDWECYGNTGNSKAENIKSVCQRNQLKESVYIGDTAGDQQAAMGADLKYFHVNYGFGEPVYDCWRFDDFVELTKFFLDEG